MLRRVQNAWKNTSTETGSVLFVYTSAVTGVFFEEQLGRPAGSISGGPVNSLRLYRRLLNSNDRPEIP